MLDHLRAHLKGERAVDLGFRACPTDAGLREGLIALRSKRQDFVGVADALRCAIDALPGDDALVRRLVEAYRSAGDAAQALEILEDVVRRQPDNAALYRERAALLSELGREDEALSDLERVYDQTGESAAELTAALERAIARADGPAHERELTLRLVQILERIGDATGVKARLRYLVEVDPNDRDALVRLADLEAAAGNWEGASLAYVQLVPLLEGQPLVDLALKLAEAGAKAGRPEDARVALEQAARVSPDNGEVRARLRGLYEAIGENRQLAQMLQQDAAAEPDVAQAVEHLLKAGELLLGSEGDLAEGVRVLEQVRSLAPENLYAVVYLARCYGAMGRGEDAMALLEGVANEYQGKRIRELASVYQEMARMQYEEGVLTFALESLNKAFEMDLRNAALGMQLGELALESEEWDTAGRAFRQVSMMKPYDEEKNEGVTNDQKADANYYLAWLSHRGGDLRKARILAAKALSIKPDHEQAKALIDSVDGKA